MSDRTYTDLPLFSWEPPQCAVLAFPMNRRIGKIRDTAMKWLDKPTERSAEHYQRQVTEAIESSLKKLGFSKSQIDEEIGSFWVAVDREARRIVAKLQQQL